MQEMGGSRLEIDPRICFDAPKAHCVRWHGTTDRGEEKRRALRAVEGGEKFRVAIQNAVGC